MNRKIKNTYKQKDNTAVSEKQISAETALSEWLKTWLRAQRRIKPTTMVIYSGHIYNHIIPAIGKYTLNALTTEVLQDFTDSLTLAPSTIKTVFATLKISLSAAEEKGYISNIWSRVRLPQKEKPIIRILSVGEQKRLEAVLTNHEDIGILISLYTGLRIGEVCALKWENIDFENNIMYILGTQSRTEGGIEITSPKSKSSKRVIPLPAVLVSRMNNINAKTGFVLSNSEKPYDVRSYRRLFKSKLAKANIPDIKFHALRHTFATRALEVGMDYRTLSEILGHSSTAITLDLYAHSLNEHKRKEMEKLSNIFN